MKKRKETWREMEKRTGQSIVWLKAVGRTKPVERVRGIRI